MALNPTDRYYRAEVVPSSIDDLGEGLCEAYDRPPEAFGAKGNLVHTYGYHRSRAWILNSPDSRYGVNDYSVRHANDKLGDSDSVSAFDFVPAEWGTKRNRQLMVEITTRVYVAAKARDPRLYALREFAGTIDGKTVITFNCADGSLKNPFDSSHVDHGHGSFWRRYAADHHGGVLAVMLGEEGIMLTNDDLARMWTVLMNGAVPAGFLKFQPGVHPESVKQITQWGDISLSTLNAKLDKVILGIANINIDPADWAREVAEAIADDPSNPLTSEHIDDIAAAVQAKLSAALAQ